MEEKKKLGLHQSVSCGNNIIKAIGVVVVHLSYTPLSLPSSLSLFFFLFFFYTLYLITHQQLYSLSLSHTHTQRETKLQPFSCTKIEYKERIIQRVKRSCILKWETGSGSELRILPD
ncbi:hypothetical protein RIF29_13638 [Crotalaria pallida]|uniref:Transmembrane protein n=1 Tax=Crotalaria pallida TaxID=3830 RepID=A0AAN9IPJ2_CROPI